MRYFYYYKYDNKEIYYIYNVLCIINFFRNKTKQKHQEKILIIYQ